MIVEDEAIIALSLEDGLGDEGFEIAGPFSACADALAWLERASPDVAVLDAVLSDGPCLDLARALQRRGVPFMIYSGVEAFEEHAPELDGVLWLEKPTAVEQVVNAVLELTRSQA
jgi:DNA-binding response OmpR family regulator